MPGGQELKPPGTARCGSKEVYAPPHTFPLVGGLTASYSRRL